MSEPNEPLEIFGLKLAPMTDAEIREREVKEQLEELERKREKLLSHYRSDASGVPERYMNESLDTYKPWNNEAGEALGKVRAFAHSNGGRTLILCGTNGTGKTHLGCGIILERGGMYIPILRLVYEVDSTMSYKARETKIQLLNRLCRCPMLVLDEIGRMKVREDVQKELAGYIIGERYADGLPTVLISNLTKLDLLKWLGEAVVDRLRETGDCFEFKEKGYRLQKRENLYEGAEI